MNFGSSPMVLGCVAVVAVLAMSYSKEASRRSLLHKERMNAIEKGVPLPEDLLAEAEPGGGQKSLGQNAAMQGTVWTSLGLGMLAASKFARHAEVAEDMRQLLGFLEVWAYPATFVGIGLLVFAFFTRDRR